MQDHVMQEAVRSLVYAVHAVLVTDLSKVQVMYAFQSQP